MFFAKYRRRLRNWLLQERWLRHLLVGEQQFFPLALTVLGCTLFSICWLIYFGGSWSYCRSSFNSAPLVFCLYHTVQWKLLIPALLIGAAALSFAARIYLRASRTLLGTHESLHSLLHDLKSPLSSCHAHLDALSQKRAPTSADISFLAGGAVRELQAGADLLASLMELTHLHGKSQPLVLETINLGDAADAALQRHAPFAARNDVTLQGVKDPSAILVYGNTGALERVISNLIDNAIRHTPAGGTVSVAFLTSRRWIEVQISDTGKGMTRAESRMIFERFYQGKQHGSAGLGLTICKQLVEAHGGSITVKSKVGQGTVFSVWLPVRES